MNKKEGRKRGRPNIVEDVPVSLAPLSFKDALSGLLKVTPPKPDKPLKKKTTKKKPTKRR